VLTTRNFSQTDFRIQQRIRGKKLVSQRIPHAVSR
jgi:hypothetical protein